GDAGGKVVRVFPVGCAMLLVEPLHQIEDVALAFLMRSAKRGARERGVSLRSALRARRSAFPGSIEVQHRGSGVAQNGRLISAGQEAVPEDRRAALHVA